MNDRDKLVRYHRLRTSLLAAALIGSGAASAAGAEPADRQIGRIEQQIRQLQRELVQMKRNLAARDAALRKAQAEARRAGRDARAARQAAERIPANPFLLPPPSPPAPGTVTGFTPGPNAPASMAGPSPAMITQAAPRPVFQVGGLTVSLGGFAALEGVFRSR